MGSKLLPSSLDYAFCVCHLLAASSVENTTLPHPALHPHRMLLCHHCSRFLTVVVPSSTLRRCCNLPPLVDADPVSWSAPEEALTTGKVFAMLSVLLTVAFEVMLPNAAAIGA